MLTRRERLDIDYTKAIAGIFWKVVAMVDIEDEIVEGSFAQIVSQLGKMMGVAG